MTAMLASPTAIQAIVSLPAWPAFAAPLRSAKSPWSTHGRRRESLQAPRPISRMHAQIRPADSRTLRRLARRHRPKEKKWHDRRPARQLIGSFSDQRELPYVGSMVPPYSGRPWRSPASNQKIPNRFNAGKPQTPANGAYLFRPSASQSSDRDAQVGMFEIEGLARGQARFGGAVSRPSRSAARPALSAWPAWHPPQPARSSSG